MRGSTKVPLSFASLGRTTEPTPPLGLTCKNEGTPERERKMSAVEETGTILSWIAPTSDVRCLARHLYRLVGCQGG
jgi:hypothetical protein